MTPEFDVVLCGGRHLLREEGIRPQRDNGEKTDVSFMETIGPTQKPELRYGWFSKE